MKTAQFLGFKDDEETLRHVMARMFSTRPEDITIEDNTQETATTAEVTITVKKGEEVLIKFSFDHVPCIKLHAWPSIGHEWKTRDRKWTEPELIETIIQNGCHLVPKTSPGGDVRKEWRYSFSLAEILLSKHRSSPQKQAYALFKILFYRYLKGIKSQDPAGRGLYSYLGKTVMMWACETYPPEHPIWMSITSSVDMLLEKLQKHLECKHLKNYFLEGINLMEGLSSDVVKEAIKTIKEIRQNLMCYIPVNFPEMILQGNDISSKVTLIYNIASSIAQI